MLKGGRAETPSKQIATIPIDSSTTASILNNYMTNSTIASKTSLTNVSVNENVVNVLASANELPFNKNGTAMVAENASSSPTPSLTGKSQADDEAATAKTVRSNETIASLDNDLAQHDMVLEKQRNSFDSELAASINYSSYVEPAATNSNLTPTTSVIPIRRTSGSSSSTRSGRDNDITHNRNGTHDDNNNNDDDDEEDENDDGDHEVKSVNSNNLRHRKRKVRKKRNSYKSDTSDIDQLTTERNPQSAKYTVTAKGGVDQSTRTTTDKNANNTNYHTNNTNTVNINTNNAKNDNEAASQAQKSYIVEYPFRPIIYSTHAPNLIIKLTGFFLTFLVNVLFLSPLALIYLFSLLAQYLFRLTFSFFHNCHMTRASRESPGYLPEFLTPVELFWAINSKLLSNSKENVKTNNPNAPNPADPAQAITSVTSTNSYSSYKSVCAGLFVIEGALSLNSVKDLIKNRILSLSSRSDAQNYYIRFTQRVCRVWAYGYMWLHSSNFDIEQHITEISDDENLNSEQDLQVYIGKLLSTQRFDGTKPLWHLYYKKNLGSERSTALVFLFHMCFADGVSLTRLFFKNMVDERNCMDVKPRFAYYSHYLSMAKNYLIGWHLLLNNVYFKLRDHNPFQRSCQRNRKYKRLRFNNDRSATTPQNENADRNNSNSQANSNTKRLVVKWSEPFDLLMLNRIKLVTRSKMNDVIISVLAGIVRNYLQKKGINNPRDMNCLMAVDLTSNEFPFRLANKAVLATMPMPVNTEGTLPRLWYTRYKAWKLKSSSEYLFFYFLLNVSFTMLPYSLATAVCRCFLNKSTFVASSLAAGDTSLASVSICNRTVKNLIYFYPPVANLAMSFSVVTFNDEVRLSLMADSDIITQPELITKEFTNQLEILFELIANRRIPGEVRRLVQRAPSFGLNVPNNVRAQDEDAYIMDETPTNILQTKMSSIQHELQLLAEEADNLNVEDENYLKYKNEINNKSEKLRNEFRLILMQLQAKQAVSSYTIPSDDEDELDPQDRVRLRSASIASRASSSSSHRRHRDSIFENEKERPSSSRKASIAIHSTIGYSSESPNMLEMIANATTYNQNESLSVDNELTPKSSRTLPHNFVNRHHLNVHHYQPRKSLTEQFKVNNTKFEEEFIPECPSD